MDPIKILVADDSHTVRVHLEQRLRAEGFEVTTAVDGVDAVEKIRVSPPHLAILDINMPRLDGYGVCQEIHDLGCDFPIIFLTSIRANAVKMLGAELGAYLTKPVRGEELVRTVRTVLETAAT